MRLSDLNIPRKWQTAYLCYQERTERIFAFYSAWLILTTLLAYLFSRELRGAPSPELWSMASLIRAPAYFSVIITLLAHYTGVPNWRPKVFLRMMSLSLMFSILGLFLIYAKYWPEALSQVSEGLMISFFGVTLLATRGTRDWVIQFLTPLILFVFVAVLVEVPLISLTPFLFGPSVMLLIGLVVSEIMRRLGKHQFLSEQEMKELATTDQLTGLLNRHAFLPMVRHAISRARREKRERFCLIIGDLDHFKTVNDTYGHDFGDLVLRETAVRLGASLRQQDAVCRWGGEEFLILLPATDLDGAMEVARKILAAMSDTPVQCKDAERCQEISVQQTISLGLACFTEEDSPESLIARADQGLYEAKAAGRNRVRSIPASRGLEAGSSLG
ncbi:GGDEF domain-containing protein [Marinobacter pelagius]|uniref:GGDEF domain-containing protein n=1 Tax=Marinobacter sp. C7 TaxID=2951363 RepID=UPI001EEFD59F|nr:GGDEF domain-containing protein [Marinobacter sp. C7]